MLREAGGYVRESHAKRSSTFRALLAAWIVVAAIIVVACLLGSDQEPAAAPVVARYGEQRRGEDVEEPERLHADGVAEVRAGAVGLLLANIGAVVLGWATVPSLATIGAIGWQLLYFSVGTVVLGVLAFNNAARRLEALNTMLMLNLVPVGVFAIEAALGRSFEPIELAGAGLVIAALAANNLYLRGASTRR